MATTKKSKKLTQNEFDTAKVIRPTQLAAMLNATYVRVWLAAKSLGITPKLVDAKPTGKAGRPTKLAYTPSQSKKIASALNAEFSFAKEKATKVTAADAIVVPAPEPAAEPAPVVE